MKLPKMAAQPRVVHKFLKSYVSFGEGGGLSGILKRDATLVSSRPGEDTVVDVAITPTLRSRGGAAMTKGVCLALLDEFSTVGVAVDDASRRPGVSLNMDVKFHPYMDELVREGHTVRFTSRSIKTGQNAAFCYMSAQDMDTGDMLCNGTHTKFLPMPFPWAYTMAPSVQEVSLDISKQLGSPMDHLVQALGGVCESVDECFEPDYDENNSPSIMASGRMCNPIGAVHGGALGSLAIEGIEWAAGAHLLEDLRIRFCAAGKPKGGRLYSQQEELAAFDGFEDGRRHFRGQVMQGDDRSRLCITYDANVRRE